MSKEFVVKTVADELGITQKMVKDVLEAALETIKKEVAKNGNFKLPGFGSFSRVFVPAKERFDTLGSRGNYTVPAHNRVKFKPGKGFKEAVN